MAAHLRPARRSGARRGWRPKRFTIFPFYFQQRSPDTNLNYTAVFPFYGKLNQRIFRSEIEFVVWPIYVKTVRRKSASALPNDPFLAVPYRYFQAMRGDITTYNYCYPFFHLRYGDGLKGWQLWPLYGRERKDVTSTTNVWGDLETMPGHDKTFVLWPFYADQKRETGTTNELRQQYLLPFYSYFSSPGRDSTSYLWPLGVTISEDRDRKYYEVDAPCEIPYSLNIIAIYPIAVLQDSQRLQAADRFIKFVLSQKGQDILVRYGFRQVFSLEK